jgi:hypothetical protein
MRDGGISVRVDIDEVILGIHSGADVYRRFTPSEALDIALDLLAAAKVAMLEQEHADAE